MKLIKVINKASRKLTHSWTTNDLPESHWEPGMGRPDRWVVTSLVSSEDLPKVIDTRPAPTLANPKETESLFAAEYTIVTEDLTEVIHAQKVASIRAERDERLAETDFTQLADAPLNSTQKQAFREYRQALRDFPETVTDVDNVVWPVKPEVQ